LSALGQRQNKDPNNELKDRELGSLFRTIFDAKIEKKISDKKYEPEDHVNTR
jgi:hypothetical protein